MTKTTFGDMIDAETLTNINFQRVPENRPWLMTLDEIEQAIERAEARLTPEGGPLQVSQHLDRLRLERGKRVGFKKDRKKELRRFFQRLEFELRA